MTPEQAALDMDQTDVLVVFKCGHWAVNPEKRQSTTGKICPVCGDYQLQDHVYIRCQKCGVPVKAMVSTRRLCKDCYRENQKYKSHKQRRNYLALESREKFLAGPADTFSEVAAAIGVSKQRVQQIEARASRTVKNRWRHASEKPGRHAFEGFVYLDGVLVIGPRSVVGADFDDAAAELLIDFWEHCHAARIDRPEIDRVGMNLFPVSNMFVRPVADKEVCHESA